MLSVEIDHVKVLEKVIGELQKYAACLSPFHFLNAFLLCQVAVARFPGPFAWLSLFVGALSPFIAWHHKRPDQK